jgi:hypothetical protein
MLSNRCADLTAHRDICVFPEALLCESHKTVMVAAVAGAGSRFSGETPAAQARKPSA